MSFSCSWISRYCLCSCFCHIFKLMICLFTFFFIIHFINHYYFYFIWYINQCHVLISNWQVDWIVTKLFPSHVHTLVTTIRYFCYSNAITTYTTCYYPWPFPIASILIHAIILIFFFLFLLLLLINNTTWQYLVRAEFWFNLIT